MLLAVALASALVVSTPAAAPAQPVQVQAGHHTQVLATALPLPVTDMYEHSYRMDYGAAAVKYIDAFFVNIQWDEVNRRLEQARQLHRPLCA
jgi:Fe-Mn family superoxide dismutase